MRPIRDQKPRRKCGRNGPYVHASKHFYANADINRILRAVRTRLNHTVVQIVEDACIEYYAPDLRPKPDSSYHGVFSGIRPDNQAITDDLLQRMRGIREERGIPLAQLVEAATQRWINENVWKIDEFGAALFGSDFDEARWYLEMREPGWLTKGPSDYGLEGEIWTDAHPRAMLARAIEDQGAADAASIKLGYERGPAQCVREAQERASWRPADENASILTAAPSVAVQPWLSIGGRPVVDPFSD